MARLADTAFGRILRDHAQAEGIDLGAAPRAAQQATLAVVSLDAAARASYDFYLDGTADWQWTAEETARVPDGTAVLHFGSLASWTPPGDDQVLGLARRLRDRGDVLVSYDPNIRPGLLADHRHGQRVVERAVGLAHLVKASTEDIAWLYPGQSPGQVARDWLRLGAGAVVITSASDGAEAFTGQGWSVRLACPRRGRGGHRGRGGLVHRRADRRPDQAGPARTRRAGPVRAGRVVRRPGRCHPGGVGELRATGQRPAHGRRGGRRPEPAQAGAC